MNKAQLSARKKALEAEVARRKASRMTTSERQAAYVLGTDRIADEPDDDQGEVIVGRLPAERGETWGDDSREREPGSDSVSRRQAARVTRGGSGRSE